MEGNSSPARNQARALLTPNPQPDPLHVLTCSISPLCGDLFCQGVGARGCEAAGTSQVTGGTMRAAVHLIFTARSLRRDGPDSVFAPSSPSLCPCCPPPPLIFPNLYLGHGAASPGAIKHSAARGGVGTLKLAIRALDGTQGAGICGQDDPGFYQTSQGKSLPLSLMELLASGPAGPATEELRGWH